MVILIPLKPFRFLSDSRVFIIQNFTFGNLLMSRQSCVLYFGDILYSENQISVSDPDPDYILLFGSGYNWVYVYGSGSREQKGPPKRGKNPEISCFKVLDVRFGGLICSALFWKPFIRPQRLNNNLLAFLLLQKCKKKFSLEIILVFGHKKTWIWIRIYIRIRIWWIIMQFV
jgi:hypothetical protein